MFLWSAPSIAAPQGMGLGGDLNMSADMKDKNLGSGCDDPAAGVTSPPQHNPPLPQSVANAHQFTFQSINGDDMPLSGFKGKAILIVNTASQCGFTNQYKDLQAVHEMYDEQGLIVIGVPCNDFGKQEPGELETIKEFTQSKYGVTFPLTQKYSVKGNDAHPFFIWAGKQKKGAFLQSSPKWNFHKFLIDKKGDLVKSYGSQVSPSSRKMRQDIERVLAQN